MCVYTFLQIYQSLMFDSKMAQTNKKKIGIKVEERIRLKKLILYKNVSFNDNHYAGFFYIVSVERKKPPT